MGGEPRAPAAADAPCRLRRAGPRKFAAYCFDVFRTGRYSLENQIGWINYYAGVAFFSLAIAAGRSLLKQEAWGLWASFACQAVQVVPVALLGGPQVQISACPFLGMKVSDTQVQFSAGFNSTFFLGTLASGPALPITVNALALVWAIRLLTKEEAEPGHAADGPLIWAGGQITQPMAAPSTKPAPPISR